MSLKLVDKRDVYAGTKVSLELHTLEDELGRRVVREVCLHPGAVCVLPWLDEETVLLIRNRRYVIGRELIELPAGTLEKGEPPIECASRELEEETGYAAATVRPLATFYTAPGVLSELMHAFSAHDLRPTRTGLEAGEEIEVLPTKFADAIAMIGRGEIVDAKTIAVLLMAERFKR